MQEKRSLTPAQIQYLRIGPKVCNSSSAAKQLQDTIDQFGDTEGENNVSLSSVSKFTYGNFENTVSNFGVLLQRNFVGVSALHQAQKFGQLANKMDRQMQGQKDLPTEGRKGNKRKSLNDGRIAIKGIFELKGQKFLVTLTSFAIESIHTGKTLETLQLPYLKLLVSKVPSSKLVKTIEGAMRQEGSTITIDYERMDSKIGSSTNPQTAYQPGPYTFQRSGQELTVDLPVLEIHHSESEYKQSTHIENKDILEIIQNDFDNADQIVRKYFDLALLEQHLGKTGVDKRSIPAPPPKPYREQDQDEQDQDEQVEQD